MKQLLALSFLHVIYSTVSFAGIPQTIVFPAVGNKSTPNGLFALQATSSSALPVSYSLVAGSNSANLSGASVTPKSVEGTVTLKASQAGNATYDPAPDAYVSFHIRRKLFGKMEYSFGWGDDTYELLRFRKPSLECG